MPKLHKNFTPLERSRFLRGFTLAEIMIVVSVLMILAVSIVSIMLRSKVTSNEASAIVNLRALYTALQIYYYDNKRSYPERLVDLSGYISPKLATGSKSGYLFIYSRESEDEFTINANPKTPKRTGVRYFYMDESGSIKYNSEGAASENDPLVE